MAARLRSELGVDVEQRSGAYGEFTVLVDDQVVLSSGPLGWAGVLPSYRRVAEAVTARLGR